MKKVTKNIKNDSVQLEGQIETIETTLEDGFVHEADIHKVDMNNYHKYHKGYSKSVTFTTDGPRITRPFVYIVCSIFFGIGLISSLLGSWILGSSFIVISLIAFFKSKKDIDAVEERYKEQGRKVTFDSKEEKQAFKKGLTKEFQEQFVSAKKSTFTKNKYKEFIKLSLPIYIVVSIIVTGVCFVFNIILGIFVVSLLVCIGILYFYIVSKIFKY